MSEDKKVDEIIDLLEQNDKKESKKTKSAENTEVDFFKETEKKQTEDDFSFGSAKSEPKAIKPAPVSKPVAKAPVSNKATEDDEDFTFNAPRKEVKHSADAPLYEDFSFKENAKGKENEEKAPKEEKAVKKSSKPKAKPAEPLDNFTFGKEDKYKEEDDDFSFGKHEEDLEEDLEEEVKETIKEKVKAEEPRLQPAKAEQPAEEDKFMFKEENESNQDEFAFFREDKAEDTKAEEPIKPIAPETPADNSVSFCNIPEEAPVPKSAPVKTEMPEKVIESDVLTDKADFTESEPEGLSKKEQKKAEKEHIKQAQNALKEREEAEKRKWSTYYHGFVLADGEKIIKEYNCLKLINPPGNGYIALTNKRILCSTNELAETDINSISGIRSKYKTSVSFGNLIFFILLGALSAACFMATFNVLIPLTSWVEPTVFSWLKIVLWVVGGLSGLVALALLAMVRRKEFHIEILTKAMSSFVSYVGLTGRAKKIGRAHV